MRQEYPLLPSKSYPQLRIPRSHSLQRILKFSLSVRTRHPAHSANPTPGLTISLVLSPWPIPWYNRTKNIVVRRLPFTPWVGGSNPSWDVSQNPESLFIGGAGFVVNFRKSYKNKVISKEFSSLIIYSFSSSNTCSGARSFCKSMKFVQNHLKGTFNAEFKSSSISSIAICDFLELQKTT